MPAEIINLAARRHQDAIGAVRHILARMERGELGATFFFLEDLTTGEPVEGYTGRFRDEPGRLGQQLGALAVRLVGLQEELDGGRLSRG